MKRMEELVKQLNQWAYAYYTLDEPLVSDRTYDQTYDELLALERETGVVLPNSPTQRVGGAVLQQFEKIQHEVPLASLDKAQTFEELEAWQRRVLTALAKENIHTHPTYLVERKFDGLTMVLDYKNGFLDFAATRGNGTIGEIITSQVKTISSIPLSIPFPGHLQVQGEGLMPLSALVQYNQTAKEPLKNARNAAAGALRNLDPKETRRRNLTAYFYNVLLAEDVHFQTGKEMMDFLKSQGFLIFPEIDIAKDLQTIKEEIQAIEEMRTQMDILIDGVVIKVNEVPLREKLGSTSKFPRWAIAYKYEAEEDTTQVLDVQWNVGRTGKLTPIAILSPVEIGGVTIQRATLNNIDDIRRKGVKVGSQVLIRRSNDVIPEIMGTMDERPVPGPEITVPEHCPACGTEVIQEGVHSFCPNSLSCKPQLIGRLTHYASRNAMDIRGLSEKTIALLMSEGRIATIPDLYRLKEEDVLELPSFQKKKTQNLLAAIEESKVRPLSRFLFSLGIPGVGLNTARDLSQHFGSFKKFSNTTVDELVAIPDIGEITAGEIIKFLQDERIASSIQSLFFLGVEPIEEKEREQKEGELTGKTIVLTGTLSVPRSEMKEKLEEAGAKVTGFVSKNTDFVLAGENAGSKEVKARELGVVILTEEQINRLLP